MAASKGSIAGGLLASTGLTLGVSGYILVSAVLLRAASDVLPPNSVAAVGTIFVLLGGMCFWLGSVFLPVDG